MNYIFKTTATMKEYNNKKWYIDGGIVSDMRIAWKMRLKFTGNG